MYDMYVLKDSVFEGFKDLIEQIRSSFNGLRKKETEQELVCHKTSPTYLQNILHLVLKRVMAANRETDVTIDKNIPQCICTLAPLGHQQPVYASLDLPNIAPVLITKDYRNWEASG